eukprot:Amastigsp_a339769_87.p3 type:complete len:160 gc:universal Amastigsp_a339769_87:210-689(+)
MVEVNDRRNTCASRPVPLDFGELWVAELDRRRVADAQRRHGQSAVRKIVEIRLDEEQIRCFLHRQEPRARDVHRNRPLKALDRCAARLLELHHGRAFDCFHVRNHIHAQRARRERSVDRPKRRPQRVGVEHRELLDRLELVNIALRDLRKLEQLGPALV